ncbi:MAG: zinc ribbon domain-containing protein [Prevotella sp.]
MQKTYNPWNLLLLSLLSVLTGCYHQKTNQHDALISYNERQMDSLSFYSKHHYSRNYNFVVSADSLVLLRQQPEELVSDMPTDSLVLYRDENIVVADIRMIPEDRVDSVWVQVAHDQHTFGWIRESHLLPYVVPDDPISQFISTFSDTHVLIFLLIISIISISYLLRTIFRRKAHIVHFNDITSFYPTLLALVVAAAATFYSSIQLFEPEMWRHFYYHPTLNPFGLPTMLSVFLCSVWAIIIITLATVEDVYRQLSFAAATFYLCGLLAVCAANYIVFSISTLYYLGYPLLMAYGWFAIHTYTAHNRHRYICGNCGQRIMAKGICPHCGADNV